MFKKIILATAFLSLILFVLSVPVIASAAPSSIINNGTDSSAYATGNYSLNAILSIVIGASRWILGIVGSLALVMFIYGGFMFLISAGSSEKIGQARKIIIAAVIGLIIVFTSFLIIKFILSSLGLNWNGQAANMVPTTCAALANQNYSCIDSSSGSNCIAGICPNRPNNIQCCQKAQ